MPRGYGPEFKARALQLIEERVRTEQCSAWVASTTAGEAPAGSRPRRCGTGGSRTASTTAKPLG